MTLIEKVRELRRIKSDEEDRDYIPAEDRGASQQAWAYATKGLQEFEEQMKALQEVDINTEDFELSLAGAEASIDFALKEAREHIESMSIENA
jgi:hypothetical protein